jgi:hypothetical protein
VGQFARAMGYERLLEEAGSFGLYQKLLCGLLVFYTTFLCGINYYTQVTFFQMWPPLNIHKRIFGEQEN